MSTFMTTAKDNIFFQINKYLYKRASFLRFFSFLWLLLVILTNNSLYQIFIFLLTTISMQLKDQEIYNSLPATEKTRFTLFFIRLLK